MNNTDWADHNVKEVPYWYDGITPEEYLKEEAYYYAHYNDLVTKGKYKPLWQQNN